MKIGDALALGSASSFLAVVIYLHGYSTTLGVNLFLYFSLNDYFRFAVEWLPRVVTFAVIGSLIQRAATRLDRGRPLTAAQAKHGVAQMIVVVVIAVLATALSFFLLYPREDVYTMWMIGGPALWWLLLVWYIKEPKMVEKWTWAWVQVLHWFPALAAFVFFSGLAAGQKAAHGSVGNDVQILRKASQVPTRGRILFLLDEYILFRDEAAGVIALPKSEIMEIINAPDHAKPAVTSSR